MSIVRVLRWIDQAHRQTDKSKYIHIQIHRDTTNGNTHTHIHSEKHTNIQKQIEIHVSRCRKIYRNTPDRETRDTEKHTYQLRYTEVHRQRHTHKHRHIYTHIWR